MTKCELRICEGKGKARLARDDIKQVSQNPHCKTERDGIALATEKGIF
jgi:hypothetical protein